jgi:hypothetical protein
MTVKVFCNKCGIDFSYDYKKLYIGEIKTIPETFNTDLCENCTTEFTNWLKEKPAGK